MGRSQPTNRNGLPTSRTGTRRFVPVSHFLPPSLLATCDFMACDMTEENQAPGRSAPSHHRVPLLRSASQVSRRYATWHMRIPAGTPHVAIDRGTARATCRSREMNSWTSSGYLLSYGSPRGGGDSRPEQATSCGHGQAYPGAENRTPWRAQPN